jgi:large subunit ribosomal protein L25
VIWREHHPAAEASGSGARPVKVEIDMDTVTLVAEPREKTGKEICKKLRAAGRVPGVVYGLGVDSVSVTVDERVFGDILRASAGTTLLSLELGGESQAVMVQEVQRHPISLRALCIDFKRIDMSKPVTVSVPVRLEGEPEAMGSGDVLQHILYEVVLEAMPASVPDEIVCDITGLIAGQAITVGDLPVPAGASFITDPHDPVVALTLARGASADDEDADSAEGDEGAQAGEE